MSCPGLHCGGCGHGGRGGIGLAVAVVLILTVAAERKAIAQAGHVLAVALEVAAITVAAAAGLGLACLAVRLGLRVKRRQASRPARTVPAVIRAVAEHVTSEPRAIEAPKPRFASRLITDQLAAVLRRDEEEED